MQKRVLYLLIIILLIISTSPVSSLSLFGNKDNNLISLNVVELKEVHYDKENTLELVLESNSNLKIDGIKVNINNNDNIIVNEQLYPYSTKIYTINTKETVNTIQIQPYNDNNHNRNIFNQIITYRITGNEENVIQPPEQIVIQENQQLQQQFNQRPSYISYTSYSKLDDNKNIIYFTKDIINSNKISTNQQGNIEFQANYMPYGEIFKEEGQEQYKFSNKELDSSNLYYFGARYYDPNIGRFTQVDPIFKALESPYMYANNNPIKYIDPTGQQTEVENYDSQGNEELPTFYFPEILVEGSDPKVWDSLQTNPSAPWFPKMQNELSSTDFHEALRETFTPELSKTSETLGLTVAWCSICFVGYQTVPQVIVTGKDIYTTGSQAIGAAAATIYYTTGTTGGAWISISESYKHLNHPSGTRLQDISKRLGLSSDYLTKSREGMRRLTEVAFNIVEGGQKKSLGIKPWKDQLGEKIAYFQPSPKNPKEGLVLITFKGKYLTVFPAPLKTFTKYE